jgi:beta-glucanase (GH16 family)
MYSKVLSSAAMALLAARLATAQTFTDCNPLDETCPAEDAFGSEGAECDFTAGACDAIEELPGTSLDYNNEGAVFSIETETNAPTVASHKRIFFGRLDVELKAAPGVGIVTSVVLESADLDEIDWEWLGGKDYEVQSNYFGKGDTSTYDRGGFHDVETPTQVYHTYSIDWTAERIQWIIDGAVVRTVKYEEAQGGTRFPQTPMEVKVGTWCAGSSTAPEGTVEWAGGLTDFSQGPFDAIYKSIKITDYAGGNSATSDNVSEYVYSDNSGSWESIEIVLGEGNNDDETSTTSGHASATHTSSHAESSSAAATTTSHSATTLTTSSSAAVTSSAGVNTTSSVTPPTSTSGEEPATSTTAGADTPTDAASGLSLNFGGVIFAGAAVLAAQLL